MTRARKPAKRKAFTLREQVTLVASTQADYAERVAGLTYRCADAESQLTALRSYVNAQASDVYARLSALETPLWRRVARRCWPW